MLILSVFGIGLALGIAQKAHQKRCDVPFFDKNRVKDKVQNSALSNLRVVILILNISCSGVKPYDGAVKLTNENKPSPNRKIKLTK